MGLGARDDATRILDTIIGDTATRCSLRRPEASRSATGSVQRGSSVLATTMLRGPAGGGMFAIPRGGQSGGVIIKHQSFATLFDGSSSLPVPSSREAVRNTPPKVAR